MKTLDAEMIGFFAIIILLRINITIAGEINSGKTTLLNAIDLLVPSNFRKIYVEDTIETLNMPFSQSYQLKYITNKSENAEMYTKEKDIYKLLHRSGDYIFLGEILTKQETQAMFHCLSTGLIGIQTLHAANLQPLLNRWLIHYKIEKNCLNDLGIVVIMKKIGRRRIIYSISEIIYNEERDQIIKRNFFKYNPERRSWDRNIELFNSKILSEIKGLISLPKTDLNEIQNILLNGINRLTKENSRSLYNPFKKVYWDIMKIIPSIGQM